MKRFYFISKLIMAVIAIAMSATANAQNEGKITFSTNDVKINAGEVTANDNLGNSWTITTVGTTSYAPQPTYCQVGSAKAPASSITLTATISEAVSISSVSVKLGGFSGTAGDVNIDINDTNVASGSLNESTNVTVSSDDTTNGNTITITITNIARGVRVYNVSYVYNKGQAVQKETPDAAWKYNNEEVENANLDISDPTTGVVFSTTSDGSITYESDNTDVASIDSDGKITLNGVGVAILTAKVAETSTYKSATSSISITVADKSIQKTKWDVADYGFANGETVTYYIVSPALFKFSRGTNTRYGPKYYDSGKAVRCYGGNTITVYAPEGYTIISIKFTFATGGDSNATTTNVGTFKTDTWSGESNEVIFTISGASGQRRITAIDVTYTKANGYECLPMAVTSAKYATFCAPFEVNVPEGITAYTADGVKANGGIVLTETSTIPANTPVILSSASAVMTVVSGIPTEGTPAYGALVGTYEATEAPAGSYVLQNQDGKVGFYKVADPVSVGANRCYLVSTNDAKAFYLEADDATAINGINAEITDSNAIYNIAGQRVSKAGKGIYIVGGKKVIY